MGWVCCLNPLAENLLNSNVIVTPMVYLGFSPIALIFFFNPSFCWPVDTSQFFVTVHIYMESQKNEKAYIEILDLVPFTLKYTMALFIRYSIDKTEESLCHFLLLGEGILGKSTMF